MTSVSSKRTYTKLNHLTDKEKREYFLSKRREYARRYKENDPEKINKQALQAVKKWYSKEEKKQIKCLKNKVRWYINNIKLLEDDVDNLNTRQIKRLSTLKNMLDNILQEHPEVSSTTTTTTTKQDDTNEIN